MAEVVSALVVDDEPDVRWALAMILRKQGVAVTTAGSGDEALRWLSGGGHVCDLILLDAKLSDIDGVDLARRIRSETGCRSPVILVSGYFYKDDSLVQNCLGTGLIRAFVTKPFRHEQILDAIRAVLPTGTGSPPMASPP
jgi:CheY-like chemotaxis protein